ncbi:MAG: hypothetical protein ACREVA_03500, partial [Burkholderiales bacterium]
MGLNPNRLCSFAVKGRNKGSLRLIDALPFTGALVDRLTPPLDVLGSFPDAFTFDTFTLLTTPTPPKKYFCPLKKYLTHHKTRDILNTRCPNYWVSSDYRSSRSTPYRA